MRVLERTGLVLFSLIVLFGPPLLFSVFVDGAAINFFAGLIWGAFIAPVLLWEVWI